VDPLKLLDIDAVDAPSRDFPLPNGEDARPTDPRSASIAHGGEHGLGRNPAAMHLTDSVVG
jgi:hypothetical protein